jgi:hypothetical protein
MFSVGYGVAILPAGIIVGTASLRVAAASVWPPVEVLTIAATPPLVGR